MRIKQKYGMKMGRSFKFGIPKISCGLAGGSWSEVSIIIDEIMVGENITCVNY